MDIGRGKVVLALEGGDNHVSLANSAQACVEVLLQDRPIIRSSKDLPLKSTELVIQAVSSTSTPISVSFASWLLCAYVFGLFIK